MMTQGEWDRIYYPYDSSRRPKLIKRDRSMPDPRLDDPELQCGCGHVLVHPHHIRAQDAWGSGGCRWCSNCHRDPLDLKPIL